MWNRRDVEGQLLDTESIGGHKQTHKVIVVMEDRS